MNAQVQFQFTRREVVALAAECWTQPAWVSAEAVCIAGWLYSVLAARTSDDSQPPLVAVCGCAGGRCWCTGAHLAAAAMMHLLGCWIALVVLLLTSECLTSQCMTLECSHAGVPHPATVPPPPVLHFGKPLDWTPACCIA